MELGIITTVRPLIVRPFVAFSEEDDDIDEDDDDIDDDFGDDDDEEKLDDGFIIEGDEVADEEK
jgi:hypothetical protein